MDSADDHERPGPAGVTIEGTPYRFDPTLRDSVQSIDTRVAQLRAAGPLPPDVVDRMAHALRVRNIFHSNAIEGNRLTLGETRAVIEDGITIASKPAKDQAEARNLAMALDFLETLAADRQSPLTAADILQLHSIVLKDIDVQNAGRYRQLPVTIGGSAHVPPAPDQVPIQMTAFGNWLEAASVPSAATSGLIAAAVAHTWFVTIHPFIDGNGRTARLIMDLVLIRYGCPVIVITKDDRRRYYEALERADAGDLSGVLKLFIDATHESIQELETAVAQHYEHLDWAVAMAESFTHDERVRLSNEYALWKASMVMVRAQFRQIVQLINQYAPLGRIDFQEFELPEFDPYAALRLGKASRETWFFRVDFRTGERDARYLFSFDFPNAALPRNVDVSVHVSREQTPFTYTRLDGIRSGNVPSLAEFAYLSSSNTWVTRRRGDEIINLPVESIAREFINDVIRLDFGQGR